MIAQFKNDSPFVSCGPVTMRLWCTNGELWGAAAEFLRPEDYSAEAFRDDGLTETRSGQKSACGKLSNCADSAAGF